MSDDGPRTVRAGRRPVEIHRPGKVLFPGGGGAEEYTKGDLVDYHRAVAPFMLPHLRGRPLMLDRRPDGIDTPGFPQGRTPLDDPRLHARRWTVADAVEQARTDPWAGLPRRGRALGPARRRLRALRD